MNRIKHGAPVVFTDENGYHMVMLPSGEILSSVLETTVTDKVNEFSKCKVEFICNLAKDGVDAKRIIAEYE